MVFFMNTPPRYLFVAPRYHTNLTPMLKTLQEHNHEVRIFTLHRLVSEDTQRFVPTVFGYSILLKAFTRKLIGNTFLRRFGFPPILKYFREIKSYNPDVIVVRDITNLFSILTFIFGSWTLKKKIIILLQVNDRTALKKRFSIKIVWKLFNAKVVTPLYISDKVLSIFRNLYVIPFAQEVFLGERSYFLNDRINILSIGKYVRSKGQNVLLKALSQLPNSISYHCTFVGAGADKGYFAELEDLTKEFDLVQRVTWKKDLSWEATKKEYLKHDIFVLPTIHEPASVSVLEAMSYGLPVISSDGNGTSCYIDNNQNGFVFHSQNIVDLRKCLQVLMNKKNLILEMGKEAEYLVKSEHSSDSFYKKFKVL